jgi:hypothetical protein
MRCRGTTAVISSLARAVVAKAEAMSSLARPALPWKTTRGCATPGFNSAAVVDMLEVSSLAPACAVVANVQVLPLFRLQLWSLLKAGV